MRSLRPGPLRGRPVARAMGMVTVAAAVSGCSALGLSDGADSGPPRLSPEPRPEVATAMIESRPAPEMRLNACELLDLTPARVIALTGADMPEVEPTGSGDLGLLCTYGGPGSPERYAAQRAEEEAETESASASEESSGAETATTTEATTTEATITEPRSTEADPDVVPDSFAAGVVKPRGGSRAALAGQAVMLGVRYACSEIRGEGSGSVEGAPPAAPAAPAPVRPELDSPYIDCVASPTGGGVEVHTIFVADNDLWHITLVKPETPRAPETEARALAGLHRVADQILA